MMFADEAGQCFSQTDESDRQRTVLDYFFDRIVGPQFLRVHIQALSHQERQVFHFQPSLHLVTMVQLFANQIKHFVELLIKFHEVAVRFYCDSWQVQRCEAEVSPAVGCCRTVYIGNNPCSATHIGNIRSIRSVITGVHETEGRVQPFGSNLDCQLEQIVVGVLRIKVYPFLDPENHIGENRIFALSQAFIIGTQQIACDRPALRTGFGTDIQTGKRNLCASARIMDKNPLRCQKVFVICHRNIEHVSVHRSLRQRINGDRIQLTGALYSVQQVLQDGILCYQVLCP